MNFIQHRSMRKANKTMCLQKYNKKKKEIMIR